MNPRDADPLHVDEDVELARAWRREVELARLRRPIVQTTVSSRLLGLVIVAISSALVGMAVGILLGAAWVRMVWHG